MKEEFVTYEQALALKELGFDEPCMFVHDTWGNTKNWTEDGEGEHRNSDKNASIYYSAPLKQQVFRWFREKHDLLSWIFTPFGVNNGYFHEIVNLSEAIIEGGFRSGQSAKYTTYEEAELACINELIEIIKNK